MFNTLKRRQYGRHFPDDILKFTLLNENISISLKIPLWFVPKGPINNIPSLVQIKAWHRPGDKPLSEPNMVRVPTHIGHSASVSSYDQNMGMKPMFTTYLVALSSYILIQLSPPRCKWHCYIWLYGIFVICLLSLSISVSPFYLINDRVSYLVW